MLSLEVRMRAERRIVRAALKCAIRRGYTLHTVVNGEDDEPVRTVTEAMVHAFACDDAHVFLTKPGENHKSNRNKAWFYFVLGNSGWDVISDYTTVLDPVVNDVEPLVARYEAMDR